MSRKLFGIEQGLHIFAENADTGVVIWAGANAPGSYGTFDDDAEVGSMYLRTNGEQYLKDTAGAGTDKWVKMATIDDVTSINWRPELVRALTATAAPSEGGTVDATALTDDDGSLSGSDFAVGEYIAFGSGGTEVLGKISGIATDTLTITYVGFDVLADNDAMLVRKYLPDGAGQENQALVYYNGTDYVKLSDFDWALATGINVSSGYAAATGNPAADETVEAVLQKIDGNVDSVEDALGVSQGDTNMGTFTGTIISDSGSAKAGMQELETDLEALQTAVGVAAEATDMGTYTGDILTDNQTAKVNIQELETEVESLTTRSTETAITTIEYPDSVLCDEVRAVVWDVVISLDSDPARVKFLTVSAVHDGVIAPGTPANAATVDNTVYSKLKLGVAFNSVVTVSLDGTGASQVMRLGVSASAAVSAFATRRTVV